jgi:hypothetical protein
MVMWWWLPVRTVNAVPNFRVVAATARRPRRRPGVRLPPRLSAGKSFDTSLFETLSSFSHLTKLCRLSTPQNLQRSIGVCKQRFSGIGLWRRAFTGALFRSRRLYPSDKRPLYRALSGLYRIQALATCECQSSINVTKSRRIA